MSKYSQLIIPFLILKCFMAISCLANEWKFQNPLPDGNFVEDIHYFDDSHAIAVGNCGHIWSYTHSKWSTLNISVETDLEAIWTKNANSIYVAGKNGVILHYDGNEWNRLDISAIENWETIHFSDIWEVNDHIFVVGDGIISFKHQNANASVSSLKYNKKNLEFNSVLGNSENSIFAVGKDGIIFYFDGDKWEQQFSPTEKDIESIWKRGTDDFYAVGEDGLFLAYDGNYWNEIETNLTYHLFDISGDDHTIWIAGGMWQQSGVVIQYEKNQFSNPHMLVNIPFSSIDVTDNAVYVAGSEMYCYTQNQWEPVELFRKGFFTSINGIWGNSTNNIYAVGENGALLHYNGTIWEKATTELSSHLNAIWGLSSDNILAVGNNGTIIHYNGSSWSVLPVQTQYDLQDVWGIENQFFIVGNNGILLNFQNSGLTEITTDNATTLNAIWGTSVNNIYAAGNNGLIMRFDGQKWNRIQAPTENNLFDIWGHKNDIYAVGKNGCILRYNGNKWLLDQQNLTKDQLDAVWGTSDETYVAGENGQLLRRTNGSWEAIKSGTTNWLADGFAINEYDMRIAGFGGTILRYTGQRLTIDAPAYVLDTADYFSVTTTIYPTSTQTIKLSGEPDIIDGLPIEFSQSSEKSTTLKIKNEINGHQRVTITAMIDNGRLKASTNIWVLDSQAIQEVITSCHINAISGWDEETIFAMGITEKETIDTTGMTGEFFELKDKAFARYPFVLQTAIEDIWYVSKNIAFAVGHNGKVLNYNGSDWIVTPSDTGHTHLYGIWGENEQNVFAVGDHGTIFHYNGKQWNPMESGTENKLNAIWGTSKNNIYAVGESSTILHFDGNSWTTFMENADVDLFDIWGADSNSIFVAGSNGTIMYFDGTYWQKQTTHLTTNLYGIWGTCANEVFVVGENSTIGYYDGQEWVGIFDPILKEKSITFWDVWGTSGTNVFFAGNALYHYQPEGIQLSPIHSHIVCKGLALTVPFSLTGAQDFNQVKLSAYSTNEQLLPNDSAHISFQGSGANRVLVLTPDPQLTGKAFITVSASEQNGFPCKTTFSLTVKSLREILQSFYDQTDGDNWYRNEGWDTLNTDDSAIPSKESPWYGIELDSQTGTVISLSLASNGLSGRISSDIFGLSHLESLDLSYNHLEGEIPHEISVLSKMKQLDLASNKLTGHLPRYMDALNALKMRSSDLRWNALFSKSDDIREFLSFRQEGGDWISTQTLAPSNFHAMTIGTNYLLEWDLQQYSQDKGGYELVYATPVIPPYNQHLATISSKHDQQVIIKKLIVNGSYRFGIRTFTSPHENNPNTVFSVYNYINSLENMEIPKLKFTPPSLIREGASPLRATVSIDSPKSIDIPITVISSDHTVIPIPSEITIHAGSTETYFNLKAESDGQYVSSKQVALTLWTANESFTFTVQVLDQETPYWRTMLSPTLNDLNAVWGDSINFLIAVGNYGTILQFEGEDWIVKTSPTEENLYNVWGSSSKNIYAVGASGTILHFEGSVWQKMNSSTDEDLHTISGFSDENILAGGKNGSVVHFDGFQWHTLNISENQFMSISDMWAYSDNKCMLIGQLENNPVVGATAIIERTTNLNARMLTPVVQELKEKEKYTAIWGTGNMFALSAFYSDTESSKYTGSIYKGSIGNYENIISVEQDIPEAQLNNIWGATYNEMYAIGTNGSIFYHHETNWEKMHSGTEETLNDIWGIRDSSIFAVGDNGTILQYVSDEPDYAEWDSISIQPGTVKNDYKMASICVNLEDKSSESALHISMDIYSNGEQYRIGTYDAMTGGYINYGPNLIFEPGRAYWFLVRDGQEFSFYGRAVSHVLNFDLPLAYNDDTGNGWNMIACPNKNSYEWSKLKVFRKNDSGEIVDFYGNPLREPDIPYIFELPDKNNYISKYIHQWVGYDASEDGYNRYSDIIMKPNQGYFVKAKNDNVYLRFSLSAQTTDGRKRTQRTRSESSDEESPPAPMGELTEGEKQQTNQDVSDSFCFIETIFD